jgi:pyruvate carboxylase
VLPTPIYFYGMKVGEEAMIDLEPGKTLNVRLQTIGEADARGGVKVFFELNGQPRVVVAPGRGVGDQALDRRKIVDGNPDHIGAPMPGSVNSVRIEVGQVVRKNDIILTIEAMKMESALRAPHDGMVQEVLVTVGSVVDAKDLLAVIA